MTAPEPQAGLEAPDPGRFEPTAYDLGITGDPEPQSPSHAGLWAAQNAPRIANAAGCTDAEYERILDVRQQAEAAYLARHGSLAPEPRTEAELAAAARAEAWGPQSPVPYSLTPDAEAALDSSPEPGPYPGISDPERLAAWCGFATATDMRAAYEDYARAAEAEEKADLEAEWEAELADNWDSADSAAYADRVEAGLEPEAEP
jgi:hypothetical protein